MLVLLSSGGPVTVAQTQEQNRRPWLMSRLTKIPNDQLDSLVAPIALYPDPMLASSPCCIHLSFGNHPAASRVYEEQRDLKDKPGGRGAEEAWDPSIQSMLRFDVVKRLADDIGWTPDLEIAVLARI